MNARRAALDELWHPAAATALERALHPAGHGPNSSSLHSLFCRYATSSPDRGKSLAAGRSRRRCIISGRIIYNRAMPGGLRTARHCVFTGKAVTACADAGSLREHSRQHENMLLPLRFVAQATVNRRNTQSTRKRSAREAHLSGCIPRQLNNFNKK